MNKNVVIWKFKNQKICVKNIEEKLKKGSLQKGDIVMIHADTKVFGKIGDIKDRKQFYNTIIDSIISVIGDEGALIIPAYTYSFCHNQTFDIMNSKPSIRSTLSNIAFERYRSNVKHLATKTIIRSNDPMFSCIGFGDKSTLVINNLGNECFGTNSIFDKLYKNNAKLMCFGFKFAATYMHYVEKYYHNKKKKLEYRFDKKFSGHVIDKNKKKQPVTYTYYVRDQEKCAYNFSTIITQLKHKNLLKKARLGGGEITLCTTKNLYDTIFKMLDTDKFILLNNISKSVMKGKKGINKNLLKDGWYD